RAAPCRLASAAIPAPRRGSQRSSGRNTPRANSPRQPMIGPSEALGAAAARGPAGSKLIDAPLIQPRFDAGTNSCSSGMSTAKNPPIPKPTIAHHRQEDPVTLRRQRHQAGGERKRQDRDHEHFAAADLVAEPSEEVSRWDGSHARGKQDQRRL